MSTFVLVHGAWQSAGTWDLLVPLLQRQGHKVIMPILRGLGADQSNLTSDITLHQHIEDVTTELRALPEQAVLVGHSYAGMVISGAVESNPSRVRRLVFLDAFIPEDGQCALDLLPPEIGTFFRKVAAERGNDGWRLPGGEGQLDLWGLSQEKPETLCARSCAILVCAALRNRLVFEKIRERTFLRLL